nr:type I restriction endonuclease [Methanosarcina horonobensis]
MKLPDTLDSEINEEETREKLIDPEIAKWWLKPYVKEEVNIIKSDFKRKSYVIADGVYKSGEKYIDYLLLDEDLSPLAIIEAKRYAKHPEEGRIQARTYAKDIENEMGIIIPIFLTNGKEWKFIDFDGQERKVGGLFSQKDLSRRRKLHTERRDLIKYGVNTGIVDRKKSVTIVEILNKHFSEGCQRALVHMATGTGKTRVAMLYVTACWNAITFAMHFL